MLIARDRIELLAAGKRVTHWFLNFAPGREIKTDLIPVGELHFSRQSYPDSHFVFLTEPRITIYMPEDGPTEYPDSHFWRVQALLREGGFKLYDEHSSKRRIVLDLRPVRTAILIIAVLAFAWGYASCGFLPDPVGPWFQHHFLHNRHNPNINIVFLLPALIIPLSWAFRHARTPLLLLIIAEASFVLTAGSEYLLRWYIHPWASLELPPFNTPMWSVGWLVRSFLMSLGMAGLAYRWRQKFMVPLRRHPVAK